MVENNVRYAQLSFYFSFLVQRRSKMRTSFYFDKFKIVLRFSVYEAESFSKELTSVENLIIELSLPSVNYKFLFKRSAGEACLDIHQKSTMS